MSQIVIKIGGSLLNLEDLDQRIRSVIDMTCDSSSVPVLIVGGGPAADLVRDWSRIHAIPENDAHWLAVQSLTLSAQLFIQLADTARLVMNPKQIRQAWEDGSLPVLDCEAFLKQSSGSVELDRPTSETQPNSGVIPDLPRTWAVTSDSIALWVSLQLGARKLFLLKSLPCPYNLRPEEAAAAGLIDDHFPTLFDSTVPCTVHWCNLRAEMLMIDEWA